MSSSPSSDSSSLTLSSFDELTEKVGDLLITSTLPSNLSDCSAPSTSSGRSQSAVSSGVESASDYYDILLDLDVVMRAAFRVPSDWRTKYSHLVEVVRQDTQFQKCLAAFRHLKETVDEDKNIGLLQEMSSCVGRVVAHNADISLTPPGSQIAVAGAFDPLFQAAGVNLKVYDLRSHRAVVSLKGNNLRLIYHDHSAMVFSRWFSIVDTDDIDIFIAMLIGYNSLSDAERRPNGFVTILDPEQQEEFICNVQSVTASQRDVFSGLKIHLEREGRTIIVDVEHVIFRDEQLEGRSTCVLAATSEEWPNKQLAVKLCWQGAGRRRDEEEYIRAARDKAEEIGDHWVIDHLPDILHTQDIVLEGDATEERLTQFFRDECDVPKGFVYHPRHLRVIVSELLFPITSLSSETEVAQVFVLAIQCHKWLFDNPRILHRDINTNNIMYRLNRKGAVCGVLNDFDMSCYRGDIVNGLPPAYLRNTGTLPYLALDRSDLDTLHTASHFYCHDLESFFYVMFLFTSRHVLLDTPIKRASGPPQRYIVFPGAPFDDWYKGDDDYLDLLRKKRQLLMGDFDAETVSSSFSAFAPWLVSLHGLIRKGLQARAAREKEREDLLFYKKFWEEEYVESEHAEYLDDDDIPSADMVEERLEALDAEGFEQETLGGYVTCENFMPLPAEAGSLKMLVELS